MSISALSSLNASTFGILIARGDLAVEIEYENLSLVQEDVICLGEAANITVILATQVLEILLRVDCQQGLKLLIQQGNKVLNV